MNISKHSFITRLLCCLLVCLLLCGTVMRPISADATIAGATAGLAYISVEAVIPWILSALSVGYLASYGSELFYSVKEAICNWAVSSSLGQALKAYSYGSDYYLESDVVEAAATVVNDYLAGDFSTACEIGSAFPKAFVITYSVMGDTYKSYYWGNSKPTYYYDDPYLIFLFQKPGVEYHLEHLFDFSADESATFSSSVYGGTLVSIESVSPSTLAQSDVLTEANTLATSAISVNDPSGGKKNVYPIIATQDVSSSVVETTDTTVSVGASTASDNSTDLSGVLGWLAKIYNAIVGNTTSIKDTIVENSSSIKEKWDTITSTITTAISDVRTVTSNIYGSLMNVLRVRIEAISSAISTFQAKVETLWDTATTTITTAISTAIEDIIEWLKSLGASITDILEWLLTLPGILVDAITDALTAVFVPAEDYLDAKVDTLLSTYTFLHGFGVDAKFLKSQLSALGTTPPVIYIPLGSSETSYSIGGDTIFLDLSWYAKYKPTVDAILSAFLWILFIWKLFLKLPGIVSGLPGDFVMGGLNDFGLADYLPSRKAAYEVQRQSNREYIRKGGK